MGHTRQDFSSPRKYPHIPIIAPWSPLLWAGCHSGEPVHIQKFRLAVKVKQHQQRPSYYSVIPCYSVLLLTLLIGAHNGSYSWYTFHWEPMLRSPNSPRSVATLWYWPAGCHLSSLERSVWGMATKMEETLKRLACGWHAKFDLHSTPKNGCTVRVWICEKHWVSADKSVCLSDAGWRRT